MLMHACTHVGPFFSTRAITQVFCSPFAPFLSMSHLDKWSLKGTRTKAEISSEALEEAVKRFLPDPSKNARQWMEASLDEYIDVYCEFLRCLARHTYRLSKIDLKKAILQQFGIADIHADTFATKAVKAFQSCWMTSKNASNGVQLAPSKLMIIEAWADRGGDGRGEASSSSSKRIKVEAPVAVKNELTVVKTEILAAKREADTTKGLTKPSVVSPLKRSSTMLWDSTVKGDGSASASHSFSPKVVWGGVKPELVPEPPALDKDDKKTSQVASCHFTWDTMRSLIQ